MIGASNSQKQTPYSQGIQRDVTLDPRGSIHRKPDHQKGISPGHHTQGGIWIQFGTGIQPPSISTFYSTPSLGEIDWKAFDAYLEQGNKEGVHAVGVRYPYQFDLIGLLSKENIKQTLQEVTPKGYHYQKLTDKLYQSTKSNGEEDGVNFPTLNPLERTVQRCRS